MTNSGKSYSRDTAVELVDYFSSAFQKYVLNKYFHLLIKMLMLIQHEIQGLMNYLKVFYDNNTLFISVIFVLLLQ